MYNSSLTQQITKLFKIIHVEKLLRNCYYIPAELLKWGGDAMVDELKKIANIVWHTVKAPEKLNAGLL